MFVIYLPHVTCPQPRSKLTRDAHIPPHLLRARTSHETALATLSPAAAASRRRFWPPSSAWSMRRCDFGLLLTPYPSDLEFCCRQKQPQISS